MKMMTLISYCLAMGLAIFSLINGDVDWATFFLVLAIFYKIPPFKIGSRKRIESPFNNP
jgi:hypothetical protein